jgi:hypothetical protein
VTTAADANRRLGRLLMMDAATFAHPDDVKKLRDEMFSAPSVEAMTPRSRDLITRCAEDMIEHERRMADAEASPHDG